MAAYHAYSPITGRLQFSSRPMPGMVRRRTDARHRTGQVAPSAAPASPMSPSYWTAQGMTPSTVAFVATALFLLAGGVPALLLARYMGLKWAESIALGLAASAGSSFVAGRGMYRIANAIASGQTSLSIAQPGAPALPSYSPGQAVTVNASIVGGGATTVPVGASINVAMSTGFGSATTNNATVVAPAPGGAPGQFVAVGPGTATIMGTDVNGSAVTAIILVAPATS